MVKYFSFLFAAMLFLLVSCSDNGTNPAVIDYSHSLLPLTEGNSWTYSVGYDKDITFTSTKVDKSDCFMLKYLSTGGVFPAITYNAEYIAFSRIDNLNYEVSYFDSHDNLWVRSESINDTNYVSTDGLNYVYRISSFYDYEHYKPVGGYYYEITFKIGVGIVKLDSYSNYEFDGSCILKYYNLK